MCQEELELIASLYPQNKCEINLLNRECYLYFSNEGNDYYKTVLTLKLDEAYPNTLPTLNIDSNQLSTSQKQTLISLVKETAKNALGDQYILIVISAIQTFMDDALENFDIKPNNNNNNNRIENIESKNEQDEIETIEPYKKIGGKPKPTSGKENPYVGFNQQTGILDIKELKNHIYPYLEESELKEMCIIRTPTTELNKSKFFTHTAFVKDENQAKRFVAWVQNRFSDATHNMVCYRVKNNIEINEVADDDGEKAASGKMMFVMHQVGVYNRAVVVTRYWGGILLGSIRFKMINESMMQGIVIASQLDPNFLYELDKPGAKRWMK